MARRVNSKFLLVLTIVVVGLGLFLFVAKKFLIRESPEKYVSAGSQAMAEKNYHKAVDYFVKAVSLSQKDPSLWVAYGDALDQLSPEDLEYMRRAQKAWNYALSIDPSYKPALDRTMQFLSDAANLDASSPELFKQLHDTAERLFAADPKNDKAEIAVQTSIIRPWLAGVERDEKEVVETIAKLQKLMERYPDNPDLPMFAAQGKIHLAEKRHQQDDDAKAKVLTDEGNAIMAKALKAAPQNAAMYFSAAQVASMQKKIAADAHNDADFKKWRDNERDMYAKAREFAKQDDPLYVYIHIFSARSIPDDKEKAEKILRDLAANDRFKEDQQVRLALAEQLASDPKKREEALKVLDQPFGNAGLRGPKAYLVRELQIKTLVMATNLRLDQLINTKDEKQRKEQLDKIQDNLNLIAARDGEGPRVLRLRGKLLRVQGKTVEAIQTLEKARGLAEQRSGALDAGADRIERWEVMDMLARAYLETGQIGRAKALLTDLIYRFPNYEPGRMLLATVLVKEGKYEEAAPHVKFLAEKKPNDPDVMKLQLQIQDPKGVSGGSGATAGAGGADKTSEAQRKMLKATFSRFPEDTKQQLLDKISVALYINQQDDAVRLLNKAAQQSPGDYDVSRAAVSVYRNSGDMDAAKAFVDNAIKQNPNEPKLKVLKEQIANFTPEGLAKVAIQQGEQKVAEGKTVDDKVVGELTQAQGYRRLNQPKETLDHLLAAKKLKPDDQDINSLLFSYYLWQKNWDQAEALISPLARANQDQAGGLLFRFRLAIAREDLDNALTYGNALVQRMGEFALSWTSRAQVFQAKGDFENALKDYLAALERQSDSVDAFKGCIDCYYALNRVGEARRKITDARRALPSNPMFQELETQHELLYGNPENAVPAREEQARKDPDKPQSIMQLGQTYLACARANATKLDPAKQAKAADYFKKAKDTFRKGITKWPDTMDFYAYFTDAAVRSGAFEDSEALLKQLAARQAWKGKPEPQTLLAEFYAVTKRPAEAETCLRGVIAQQPANVDAQIKLANLLVSQKKIEDALKILEPNAVDPAVAKRRVEVLLNAGRLDDAGKALDDILKKTPSALDMLQMAIGINITQRDFGNAEKRVQRALEIDRANPTTHYYIGLLRMSQPKPDLQAAIAEFEKGRNSQLVGVESRFARADCLRRLNNPDAAIKELEDGLKESPNNRRIRIALLDAYAAVQPPRWVDHDRVVREMADLPNYEPDPDILQREANSLAARNMFPESVQRINKALELAPNDMNLMRVALVLLNKANRPQDVIQKADALVAKDPDVWWAYEQRAVAKRNMDHKDEAVKDFETALTVAAKLKDDDAGQEIAKTMGDTIGPQQVIDRIQARAEKDDRWRITLAQLQQLNGDTQNAVKNLEQVLAREDGLVPIDRERAYRFGGTVYLISNQPIKSKQCYDKLLAMVPDDMTALNNMACLMGEVMQPPQPAEGLKYSERAYTLMQQGNRRDPLVLDTHGWLLTLSGKLDEGIEVLRRANELRQIPDAHYHLGEAYLRKQLPEAATQELDMAMAILTRKIQEREPVDPTLKPKIEAAQSKAAIMLGRKRTSANANTPNVP